MARKLIPTFSATPCRNACDGRNWCATASALTCILLVAGWLTYSERIYHFDSDSLIPALASTMRWTFYYWESDRLGQLLPLLAMPVKGPLENVMLQGFLGTLMSIAVFYLLPALLPAFARAQNAAWLSTGTLAAVAFLLCSPSSVYWVYLPGNHTYGPGMCLTLSGLLLATPRWCGRYRVARFAASVVLVSCGLWVNMSIFIFAAIVVVVDALMTVREGVGLNGNATIRRVVDRYGVYLPAWFRGGVELAAPVATILAVGLGVNILAQKLVSPVTPLSHTSFAITPLEVYPGAVLQMIRNTGIKYLAFGMGFVAASCLAGAWLKRRGLLPQTAKTLWITAALFLLAVCGLRHVSLGNGSHPRYVLPGIIAMYVAGGTVVDAVIRGALGPRLTTVRPWLVPVASPIVLAIALVSAVGPPSPGAPRRVVSRVASPEAEEIVESDVGFVAGDYWAVWPTVYKANLLLADRGETRRVWGIGYRASVTRDRWIEDAPSGSGRLAYLKAAPQRSGYALDWLAKNLDLQIGPCERASERIDYHRFQFASPHPAAASARNGTR